MKNYLRFLLNDISIHIYYIIYYHILYNKSYNIDLIWSLRVIGISSNDS